MSITVVLDNIRSSYNVGSIARTCDGLGVDRIIAHGITPYPTLENDQRLPHVARKASQHISKTALGAERLIDEHTATTEELIAKLEGLPLVCLEQTQQSLPIGEYQLDGDFALVVGHEVEGVSPELLGMATAHIELPMQGRKESFNVAIACAFALYELLNR